MKIQMMQNSNVWKLLSSVLFICLLAGCKSPASTATTGAEIMKTEEAYFASVLERAFSFNTLSARMKLEFTGREQELSSRVHLKMIYNDRLQLSVQPILGIEVFRIEVTNDSIKILDRMNKRYMADSYNNLKGKTGVDLNFQNLQALFTNQIFIPGENEVSAKHFRRFRMTKNNNTAELRLKDSNGVLYTFTADADEKLLSTSIEDTYNNQLITCKYDDFQTVNRQQFPMKITAQLANANNTRGKAILTLSSPEINSPLKTDFNIPAGYQRVAAEQIINLLGKL